MSESIARALAGYVGLGESPSHDAAPVDRLHAIAAAQRPETYGERAQEQAYLASLGVDLVRLKLANVAKAYLPCLERLTVALMWRSDALRIKEAQASVIAAQCIQEHIVDFCPTCSGRGEIPDPEKVDGREGVVPMKTCPECGGSGVRRYSDAERVEAIGQARQLAHVFEACHSIISKSIGEAMFNARRYMRD